MIYMTLTLQLPDHVREIKPNPGNTQRESVAISPPYSPRNNVLLLISSQSQLHFALLDIPFILVVRTDDGSPVRESSQLEYYLF